MTERAFEHAAEAVDREPRDRPGVPMIPEALVPVGRGEPARQEADVPVLVSVDVGELTPVFSTAVPPRGLSGLMRRRAYEIPEHKAKRWLVLLLADRVDVWESRARRHPWLAAAIAATGVGLLATTGALGRRRQQPRRWWARALSAVR
jgi:hypothetical protein